MQLNFNAAAVEPDAGGFGEPVPAGWYPMAVDESSIEPTKDNATTGSYYVKIRTTIVDGPCKGRKIFRNFNLKNTNPEAERIGAAQFSALCHAVGVLNVQDTQQLHGIAFNGQVKVEKGTAKNPNDPNSEKYPDRNDISSFKHINEPLPASAAAPAAAAPSAAPANPFAKPPAAAKPPAPAVAPPSFPAPPVVPAVPAAPVAAAFPPEGWIAHPSAPGFFYKGQDVKSEADLRAMSAPPAPPAVPAAPQAAANPVTPAAVAAVQGSAPPWTRQG